MSENKSPFKHWPEDSAYEDEFLRSCLTRCAHHAKIGSDITMFLEMFDEFRETETVTPIQFDILTDKLALSMLDTVRENPYEFPEVKGGKNAAKQSIYDALPLKGGEGRLSLEDFSHLFSLTAGLKVYHQDSHLSCSKNKAANKSQYGNIIRALYEYLSKHPLARKGFGILVPDNEMPAHLVDYDHMELWASDWVILDPMDFLSFISEVDEYIPNFNAVSQFALAYDENHTKPFTETGEEYGYRFDPRAKNYAILVDEDSYKFALKRSKEIIAQRQQQHRFDAEAEAELNLLLDVVNNYKADHDNDDPDVRKFPKW